MIRKHVSFILLMLCLCVFGCDDSANLDTLLTVAPDIIAPDTEGCRHRPNARSMGKN